MKRLFAIILFFLLTSCAASTAEPLSYQRLPMSAEADFICDGGEGRAHMTFESSESYTVSFISPAIMCGVTYEYDHGNTFMCFGTSRIQIRDSAIPRGAFAMAHLFLLDPTKLSDPTPDENGVLTYTIDSGDVNAAVTLDRDVPVRIEGSIGGYHCTFTNITIIYG